MLFFEYMGLNEIKNIVQEDSKLGTVNFGQKTDVDEDAIAVQAHLKRMPGILLVTRETSYSRSTEMCHIDARVHLSAEEEVAAEESLSIYCKPVELYNILQCRAIRNPLFLQKCLRYKVEAKHKKRIKLTISLPGNVNEGPLAQNMFPMYIFLARLVSDISVAEYAAVYHFSRAHIMTNDNKDGSPVQASFVLPEINKLPLDAKSGTLAILLVSCVGGTHISPETELTEGSFDMSCFPSAGKYCLHGKIPLEPLYISWANFPNFSLGQRAEMMSTLDMRYCFSKIICSNEEKCISFQIPCSSESMYPPQQVQVTICSEEFGACEKSPYNSYTCSPSSLSHIFRLRAGNVIFNYRYYNNKLQRTEVTEDFTCPFCLVKCVSFKGLRCHLVASHDFFLFEFWVTEEYQAVNVSVKPDMWQSEIIKYDVDPKKQTFFFCSRPLRSRSKHVHPFFLESQLLDKADDAHSSKGGKARVTGGNDLPNASIGDSKCVGHVTSRSNLAGVSSATHQSYTDPDSMQSLSANYIGSPTLLQFSKMRKLSLDRSDPRNCNLLWKRQFFHSHKTQPMALEQILSDQDSEDEVDDDVADFEDRRMLDDFVDVTKDEKKMMHMWNSFMRKQRVLADGHIPWACEAFSQLHGPELVNNPALMWCWRLFVIKLWNHGLLDARAMNNCNIVLDQFQNQPSDPKT